MHYNRFALLAASLFAVSALVACSDDNDDNIVAPGTFAIVRFVNATDATLDVFRDGALSDGSLAFGNVSRCFAVDAADPRLTYAVTSTGTVVTGFTSNFVPGGAYVVIASPAAAGATRFTIVRTDDFTPNTGFSGLSLVNGINGAQNYDAYVTVPGSIMTTANATNLVFGAASAFFNVSPGTQQLRFTNAGSTALLLDAGNANFVAGNNFVGVLGPAAAGTATLRSVVIPAC